MNFRQTHIKIKSNWFDHKNKNNIFKRLTFKGFFLYLTLFRFKLHEMDYSSNQHTFVSSIARLRKETSYETIEIFELLKALKSAKVLSFDFSRWDYLKQKNEKINDKAIFVCSATDSPKIIKKECSEEEKRKFKSDTIEVPATPDDMYISVDLSLLEYYLSLGLNEKYFGIYCLIKKMSNSSEKKAWMSVEKMAETLGYDKDHLNKMVHEMNRKFLLFSSKHKNGKKGKDGKPQYYFEHRLCGTLKEVEQFKNPKDWRHEGIKKNIEKWDKISRSKSVQRKKNEAESSKELDTDIKKDTDFNGINDDDHNDSNDDYQDDYEDDEENYDDVSNSDKEDSCLKFVNELQKKEEDMSNLFDEPEEENEVIVYNQWLHDIKASRNYSLYDKGEK